MREFTLTDPAETTSESAATPNRSGLDSASRRMTRSSTFDGEQGDESGEEGDDVPVRVGWFVGFDEEFFRHSVEQRCGTEGEDGCECCV